MMAEPFSLRSLSAIFSGCFMCRAPARTPGLLVSHHRNGLQVRTLLSPERGSEMRNEYW